MRQLCVKYSDGLPEKAVVNSGVGRKNALFQSTTWWKEEESMGGVIHNAGGLM